MGKKSKKKKHRLLRTPNTYKLGKKLTAMDVYTQYLKPEQQAAQRRPSTMNNAKRAVRRFAEWWASQCSEPLPVALIRRKHLEEFREWMAARGVGVPTQNEACGVMRQLLRCAVRHEIIKDAPSIERKFHNSAAAKAYFSFEEIERLWSVLDKARWPRKDSQQRPLAYSPATFWRSTIVLWSHYGLRTQELVRLETDYRPIRWENVHLSPLTPNPVGRMECEFGWLSYVPQKQERVKPEPLVNPLTEVTRSAIDQVCPDDASPSAPVFDVSLSGVGFYQQWHMLTTLAGISPRKGSGVQRYQIKHFRKSATTWLNNHQAGLGSHVVGHASDRSGQEVSRISEKHYANNEEAVSVGLATFDPPECFKELVQ